MQKGEKQVRINKEKIGETIRFSIRLPKEQHRWLKDVSSRTRAEGEEFVSMNTIISDAVGRVMRGE